VNYQSENLQQLDKSLAAQLIKNRYFKDDEMTQSYIESQLSYYAWPQVFGSTAGPFGGIGGQAISTFTIEAWEFMGHAFLFCQHKSIKTTDKFQMGMRV